VKARGYIKKETKQNIQPYRFGRRTDRKACLSGGLHKDSRNSGRIYSLSESSCKANFPWDFRSRSWRLKWWYWAARWEFRQPTGLCRWSVPCRVLQRVCLFWCPGSICPCTGWCTAQILPFRRIHSYPCKKDPGNRLVSHRSVLLTFSKEFRLSEGLENRGFEYPIWKFLIFVLTVSHLNICWLSIHLPSSWMLRLRDHPFWDLFKITYLYLDFHHNFPDISNHRYSIL